VRHKLDVRHHRKPDLLLNYGDIPRIVVGKFMRVFVGVKGFGILPRKVCTAWRHGVYRQVPT